MWNTKLLAKGKKVNREFAFISYATPEEAAQHRLITEAVHAADPEVKICLQILHTGPMRPHSPASPQFRRPRR